ncbi:hypothetical protein OH76DRAFT_638736 [Lentinus brumalis]|uniref:Uncharacterized protein n=1 Tax=Lentinus brumalis TaxID=2498619 RepID=A0A371CHA7_9APHY|nr:hypothetical protein OH76DRAFT_638736 [Polyporus brumalis]
MPAPAKRAKAPSYETRPEPHSKHGRAHSSRLARCQASSLTILTSCAVCGRHIVPGTRWKRSVSTAHSREKVDRRTAWRLPSQQPECLVMPVADALRRTWGGS